MRSDPPFGCGPALLLGRPLTRRSGRIPGMEAKCGRTMPRMAAQLSARCSPSAMCTCAAAPRASYVVLTRPLQIGVVIGGALTLAAFAFAGYSAIVGRLAAIEQRREIARLEMVIRTLRSAAADQDAAAAELRAGPPRRRRRNARAARPGNRLQRSRTRTRAAALAETAEARPAVCRRARVKALPRRRPGRHQGAGCERTRRSSSGAWRMRGEALARLDAQLAAAETAAVAAAADRRACSRRRPASTTPRRVRSRS